MKAVFGNTTWVSGDARAYETQPPVRCQIRFRACLPTRPRVGGAWHAMGSGTTATTASLTWSASTDAVGVTSFGLQGTATSGPPSSHADPCPVLTSPGERGPKGQHLRARFSPKPLVACEGAPVVVPAG